MDARLYGIKGSGMILLFPATKPIWSHEQNSQDRSTRDQDITKTRDYPDQDKTKNKNNKTEL